MLELLNHKYFYVIVFLYIILILISSNKISADQKVRILADEVTVEENNGDVEARGDAIAISEKGTRVKSDLIRYNENEGKFVAEGNIILNDIEGNTYFFDNLISDNEINDFKGTNIKARLDDGSRIVGSSFQKKLISSLENAEYTPCLEDEYLIENCPGWKLKSREFFKIAIVKQSIMTTQEYIFLIFLFSTSLIFLTLTLQSKKDQAF